MSLLGSIGHAVGSVFKGASKAVSGVAKFLNPITTLTDSFSPYISAATSFFGGQQQNQANSAQSLRQMQFQERMRNTSWQAAVKDMRAAGINPILSYSQGGAAVPGGSSAQMINPAHDAAQTLANVTHSSVAKRQISDQLRILHNQKRASEYLPDIAHADMAAARANARKIFHDAYISDYASRIKGLEADVASWEQPGKVAVAKWVASHPNWLKAERSLNPLLKVLGGLSAGAYSAKSLLAH